MARLTIRITKRTDGRASLHCRRADGSTTWQNHRGGRAEFFPIHDLVHYAVESELGLRDGFFGLIAAGWDIADTEGRGPRGPAPAAAIEVEQLVGLVSLELGGAASWTAATLNEQSGARPIDDTELARLRKRLHELRARWKAVAPGGTLELEFD